MEIKMDAKEYYKDLEGIDTSCPVGESRAKILMDSDCICDTMSSKPCPSKHHDRKVHMKKLGEYTRARLVECPECMELYAAHWYLEQHVCKGAE